VQSQQVKFSRRQALSNEIPQSSRTVSFVTEKNRKGETMGDRSSLNFSIDLILGTDLPTGENEREFPRDRKHLPVVLVAPSGAIHSGCRIMTLSSIHGAASTIVFARGKAIQTRRFPPFPFPAM